MRLATTDLGGAGQPTLVLGPSLGTTAATLWGAVAAEVTDRFHVVGWDLPGHGGSPPAETFTLGELAAAVLGAVDGPFDYAGVSLGGAVGLHLLLEAPERIRNATLLATGARIGEPRAWLGRAAEVGARGIGTLLAASRERWFGPDHRHTSVADALLADLAATDPGSYAGACVALAGHDVRARLAEIATPVLAVAGRHDLVTPVETVRHIAQGVRHGQLAVVDDAAHQIPAEAPLVVAELLDRPTPVGTTTVAEVRAEGMRVRREVLGDAHVDRTSAGDGDFTADFQDFITRYAWGSVWTRPGLDRRARSMITLTALVARGHHEELALHVRAARTNGLSVDEIKEVLLHAAVYCGVPDANTAFRVAGRALEETP